MKDSLTTTRTIILSGIELEDALTAYFGIPEGEASFTWSTDFAPDVTITADVTPAEPATLAADDGRIKWAGGTCPVHIDARVDVWLRGGLEAFGVRAEGLDWSLQDDQQAIVAYREVLP